MTDELREAYITALVMAWEQAHWVAARVPGTNGVGIVSNIEDSFKAFIPDWREASAEAARRASLVTPAAMSAAASRIEEAMNG